jgi:hypothetical protein
MYRSVKSWWRTASAVAMLIVLTMGARASLRVQAGPPGDPTPVPLPGFEIIPGFEDIEVHAFFPGFLGEDIDNEPSALTNFRGFTALAYHAGTAMDGDGTEYAFFTDLRVMQGEYVSVDGTHHRGTFVLI